MEYKTRLLGKAYQFKEDFCDLWMVKDRQEALDRYESLKESIPTDLQPVSLQGMGKQEYNIPFEIIKSVLGKARQ